MLNKKGFTIEGVVLWTLYGICMLIFIVVLRGTILQAVEGIADTHYLENYVLYDRIIRSEDSIFYYDKTIDRAYPGVIDLSKFYEDTLHGLFGEKDKFGINVSLGKDQSSGILYNGEIYRLGKPIYNTTNPLYGGIEHSFPVVVGENNDVLLIGLMYQKW